MWLKVNLIFCIISIAWISESRAGSGHDSPTLDEYREFWANINKPRPQIIQLSTGSWTNKLEVRTGSDDRIVLYDGPDEGIQQYGYDNFTDSTIIVAQGHFQADVGFLFDRGEKNGMCLFLQNRTEDEKIYVANYCEWLYQESAAPTKAHIQVRLNIPKHGHSTFTTRLHCEQHINTNKAAASEFNITGLAVLLDDRFIDCSKERFWCNF